MEWLYIIGGLVVIVIILALAFSRRTNDDYHAGSGIFKNSDYDLDDDKDKKDFCDVEYFNKDGKMK